VEIVKRSDRAKGFVVLSKRWIVERTLAWLNRCRRLAKDWENRIEKRLRSCTSPQFGSCLENFVIRPKVSGQTLSKRPRPATFPTSAYRWRQRVTLLVQATKASWS
jgi:hypothetical protein